MGEHPTPHLIRVRVRPAYTVTVGAGVLETLAASVREKRLALVSDAHVGPLYGDAVQGVWQAPGRR